MGANPDMDAELERRVSTLETKVAAMDESIKRNTEITAAIKADTSELIGLWKSAGAIGRFFGPKVKWAAAIAASLAATWAALKGGKF